MGPPPPAPTLTVASVPLSPEARRVQELAQAELDGILAPLTAAACDELRRSLAEADRVAVFGGGAEHFTYPRRPQEADPMPGPDDPIAPIDPGYIDPADRGERELVEAHARAELGNERRAAADDLERVRQEAEEQAREELDGPLDAVPDEPVAAAAQAREQLQERATPDDARDELGLPPLPDGGRVPLRRMRDLESLRVANSDLLELAARAVELERAVMALLVTQIDEPPSDLFMAVAKPELQALEELMAPGEFVTVRLLYTAADLHAEGPGFVGVPDHLRRLWSLHRGTWRVGQNVRLPRELADRLVTLGGARLEA